MLAGLNVILKGYVATTFLYLLEDSSAFWRECRVGQECEERTQHLSVRVDHFGGHTALITGYGMTDVL